MLESRSKLASHAPASSYSPAPGHHSSSHKSHSKKKHPQSLCLGRTLCLLLTKHFVCWIKAPFSPFLSRLNCLSYRGWSHLHQGRQAGSQVREERLPVVPDYESAVSLQHCVTCYCPVPITQHALGCCTSVDPQTWTEHTHIHTQIRTQTCKCIEDWLG